LIFYLKTIFGAEDNSVAESFPDIVGGGSSAVDQDQGVDLSESETKSRNSSNIGSWLVRSFCFLSFNFFYKKCKYVTDVMVCIT